MQRESHRGGTKRPETEHPLTRPADPEKGCAPFRHLQREREADDIAVEGHRAAQLADGEMGLEQTADRHVLGHRCAHGRSQGCQYAHPAARPRTSHRQTHVAHSERDPSTGNLSAGSEDSIAQGLERETPQRGTGSVPRWQGTMAELPRLPGSRKSPVARAGGAPRRTAPLGCKLRLPIRATGPNPSASRSRERIRRTSSTRIHFLAAT